MIVEEMLDPRSDRKQRPTPLAENNSNKAAQAHAPQSISNCFSYKILDCTQKLSDHILTLDQQEEVKISPVDAQRGGNLRNSNNE